ncbi:MAG: hypothetical protein H6668_02430 [Ardenticatenaceae bacterium]|nr:hypothetical protein [Ardenticatenaceae bacterium]
MSEKNTPLVQALKKQAQVIVENFDYLGIMVACLEENEHLCVYAYYIDPHVASEDWLRNWENKLSTLFNKKLTLRDSSVAKVSLHNESHQENLAIQAVRAGTPVASEDLHTLFKPVLPKLAEPFIKSVQMLAGIKEVISVPFFSTDTPHTLIGNFFAIRKSQITPMDRDILNMFGHKLSEIVESHRLIDTEENMTSYERDLARSFPPNLPDIPEVELKNLMNNSFSLDELKEVCFELNIDKENLQSHTKLTLAMDMIRYTQRNGSYERLCTTLQMHNPHAFDKLLQKEANIIR